MDHSLRKIGVCFSWYLNDGWRKSLFHKAVYNAFTCLRPLLVIKKTNLVWQSSNLQAKTLRLQFPCNSALARAFSVRRIRRRGWTTATGRDITPCFPLPFLHSSGILRAFFPRKWSSVLGPPSLLHPNAFFCLREKCNLISQFWTCWIDIFWNRCSFTHTKCRTSNDSPTGQI